MCGIAGFAGRGGAEDLRRMTAALRHRGPDAETHWSDAAAGLWLGHTRLSVLDPEGGAQPMWIDDGTLGIVYNGEVYNAPELRRALEARGRVFRSHHSDTEVLLHAYAEWGPRFVERLNGMWAFALLDRRRRRLWLSRDRFGQKPLYWARRGGALIFASEAGALRRHGALAGSGLSAAGLRKYFAYGFVPAPGSLYDGIARLPAGCNLRVELAGGEPRLERWWQFSLEPEETGEGARERADALRERLERAVARRLVADVPVGVLLSGGLDSSAVAALAARHLKPGALQSFSVGFQEQSFDERGWAERAARHVGAEHHCTVFSSERVLEALPRLAARLDEPLADASLLPSALLCESARRRVTVALGGDGADELFAGYDPFRALRWAERYARLAPRPLHRALALLAARLPTSHHNMSWEFRLKRALAGLGARPALWNPLWLAPLAPAELAELFEEPVDPEALYSEALALWDESPGASLVDRSLVFYTRLYLEGDILTKLDRASMLHSLELRSPFLDVELVDFVRRLPSREKLRGGETKVLLRRALAGLLPEAILHRPKKGFGMPVGAWIAAARPPFDAFPALPGAGSAAFLARRLAEHRAGRGDHRLYLFAHWMLAQLPGQAP